MTALIKLLSDFLQNLIFPKKCVFCDTQGSYLCAECLRGKFRYFEQQECHVCRLAAPAGKFIHSSCARRSALDGVVIVAHYDDAAKRYLHEIKYNLYYALVSELRQPLQEAWLRSGLKAEVAVPVPLHRSKLWWRGFNQAEMLAKLLDMPVAGFIKRGRNTRTQVGLARSERLQNLQGAFILADSAKHLKQRSVLLIDDVMTTGTTLEECAQVMRAAGAKHVFALTFARGD